MMKIYTAVGIFHRKGNMAGLSYPIITVGKREYTVDLQEMMLWTILNWRILESHELEEHYRAKTAEVGYNSHRSWEDCLCRLEQRGLVVSGNGENGEEALYNLLSYLYVIPLTSSTFLRTLSFLKLTVFEGVAFSVAKRMFKNHPMTDCEKQVLRLSKQALLSTAEIIKCVDKNAYDLSSNEKLMDTLYDDADTTSDNIASIARCFGSKQPVILAIANLYLRQQILFERGDVA